MDTARQAFEKFIQRYVNVSTEEISHIVSRFERRDVAKNELIFREGTVCNDFIFIIHGTLRFYFTTQEVETSVWFSFSESVGTEVQSFISGNPCKFNVQALTEVSLLSLDKVSFERLREYSSVLNQFYTKLCEETALNAIVRLVDFQYKTAEQRYNDLLTTPRLLEKIPQKYLASYLGITPTSLSRIRKKIAAG